MLGFHVGIAEDLRFVFEAVELHLTSGRHLRSQGCRIMARCFLDQFVVRKRRDLDMDINPVEEWAGNFRHVLLDQLLGAGALVTRVGKVAARAGVERDRQHETGGVRERYKRTRNRDFAVFERLAEILSTIR